MSLLPDGLLIVWKWGSDADDKSESGDDKDDNSGESKEGQGGLDIMHMQTLRNLIYLEIFCRFSCFNIQMFGPHFQKGFSISPRSLEV